MSFLKLIVWDTAICTFRFIITNRWRRRIIRLYRFHCVGCNFGNCLTKEEWEATCDNVEVPGIVTQPLRKNGLRKQGECLSWRRIISLSSWTAKRIKTYWWILRSVDNCNTKLNDVDTPTTKKDPLFQRTDSYNPSKDLLTFPAVPA